MGALGSFTAPLANWVLRNGVFRRFAEAVAGVHRDRHVLRLLRGDVFALVCPANGGTVAAPRRVKKVALFGSCLVNYRDGCGKSHDAGTGKERRDVVIPEQRCCGMPSV